MDGRSHITSRLLKNYLLRRSMLLPSLIGSIRSLVIGWQGNNLRVCVQMILERGMVQIYHTGISNLILSLPLAHCQVIIEGVGRSSWCLANLLDDGATTTVSSLVERLAICRDGRRQDVLRGLSWGLGNVLVLWDYRDEVGLRVIDQVVDQILN